MIFWLNICLFKGKLDTEKDEFWLICHNSLKINFL